MLNRHPLPFNARYRVRPVEELCCYFIGRAVSIVSKLCQVNRNEAQVKSSRQKENVAFF